MKLLVTQPGYATKRSLLSRYNKRYAQAGTERRRRFAGHTFVSSEWHTYGKLEYRMVTVEGPHADRINACLNGKALSRDAFVGEWGWYVFAEISLPDMGHVLHVFDMETGERLLRHETDKTFHAPRPGRRELLLHSRHSDRIWSRFDIDSGRETEFFAGGYEGYVSADGRLLFPVADWSFVGLVDIDSGTLLDKKTKRHLARYATRVLILRVIRFEAETPRLFLLLMKRQSLAYRSLIKETLVQIDVDETP